MLPFVILGVSILNVNKVDSALRTHNLYYNRIAGSGSQALTGTLIIDTNETIDFGTGISPIPNWVNTLDMTYTNTAGVQTNYNKSDFFALNFVKNVDTVDYTSDLVAQFTDIRFYSVSGPSAEGVNFRMGIDLAEFELESTPGPFPFLAFLPFIYLVNKIKSSIKSQ